MDIVVISNPSRVRRETDTVNKLFDAGLDCFHLRKPGFSAKRLESFVEAIDSAYRDRVVIHYAFELCRKFDLQGIHFGSRFKNPGLMTKAYRSFVAFQHRHLRTSMTFHSLNHLREQGVPYDSVFLSPVFNTISDKTIRAAFDESRLRRFLNGTKMNVVALGGIDPRTAIKAREMGFSGVALLGSVWKNGDPLEVFNEVKQAVDPQRPQMDVVKRSIA